MVAIVVTCGTAAYLSATTLISADTNDYISTAQGGQSSISERIGFENVCYNATSNSITICLINCGNVDGIQIKYVFLYNTTNNKREAIGYFEDSALIGCTESLTGNRLNILQEGYFTVSLNSLSTPITVPLSPDSIYIVNLITERGSSFDYTLAA